MRKNPIIFSALAVMMMAMCSIAQSQNMKASAPVVYTVVNDDEPIGETGHFNSGSVFVNGVYQTKFSTGSFGIGGGYLGLHSVDIDIVNGQNECVFLSDAGGVSGSGPGDIYAYNAATRTGTRVLSSFGYNGALYGIGLQHVGNVLLASWAGSGQLETFTIGSGCSLTSSQSTATGVGLSGGTADGIAIAPNGKFVVATYDDGSYGFYPLDGSTIGAPLQYNSSCNNDTLFGIPIAVAISPDSATVYMDCLYGENGAVIDAFSASNPGVTVTNGPITAAGGRPVQGSVTMGLSPDGSILYINGTFSGAIESANVSGTSVTANGCNNIVPPGYDQQWIYAGTVSVLGTGAGQGLAIPQTAFGNTPDSYLEMFRITKSNCLIAVEQGTDTNSLHALSGSSYVKQ
jgi:hypothetical protein